MHSNNHKRKETRDRKSFPWGNHKAENPTTSSEIEWALIPKVKPKDTKMISHGFSLSHLCDLLFSHSCATIEWVCVSNRVSLSIYTCFPLDNYSTGTTSLGESNNPNTPQLWGLFPWLTIGGLTSMTLHDFVILMTLLIGGTNISFGVQWNTI